MKPIQYLYSLNHIWQRTIYDQKNMVVYIPINKNATTSMENFMIGKVMGQAPFMNIVEKKEDKYQCRLKRVCSYSPISARKAYKNSFKFTIVRDPIERFISAHDMMFAKEDFRVRMEQKTGNTINLKNSVQILIEYMRNKTIIDGHFRPQTYFIGRMKMNCVIKLGRDNIVDTLTNCGLGDWISGFPDERLNAGNKTQIAINPMQMQFLKEYYEMDYDLEQKVAL